MNVAFLLGLADEFDSRAAVSTDLDLDGRVDVVVAEDRGNKGQKLHIYRNRIETENHWIGVQFREEGGRIVASGRLGHGAHGRPDSRRAPGDR